MQRLIAVFSVAAVMRGALLDDSVVLEGVAHLSDSDQSALWTKIGVSPEEGLHALLSFSGTSSCFGCSGMRLAHPVL